MDRAGPRSRGAFAGPALGRMPLRRKPGRWYSEGMTTLALLAAVTLSVSAQVPVATPKPVRDTSARAQAKPLAERFPQLKTCDAKSRGGVLMITATHAYYYFEDCDICAEIQSCELASGKLATVYAAHSLSCDSLEPQRKGAKIVYDCKAE